MAMKKKKTPLIIISFIIIQLIISHSMAQQATEEWTLHKEVSGIQVYAQTVDCIIESEGFYQEHVLLRFVNTTPMPQRISWQLEAWYSGPGYEGDCVTCDNDEYRFSLYLDAGETVTGSCDLHSPPNLKIFSKFLNYDTEVGLTDYNIAVIEVLPN